MALLSRFFGRTASEGAAYAFGVATGPVLAPATETIRQEAWQVYKSRIPAVAALAAGVAQEQIDPAEASDWAGKQGFGATAFGALVAVAKTGPDVGTAMRAWRRGELTENEFRTVLRRHAIEQQWDAAIEALKQEILDPGQLAAAIHRGLIPDPGLLRGEQPTPPFNVEAYPVYQIDALGEAAGSGYDHDRLGVLVGLQGLPMGTHEAAQATFKGIITHGDYIRAFNESNSRNEWARAVLENTRQIPTARDFMENALRGYHDLAWAQEQAARHGMSPEDTLVIYQNQGRPMNIHQITQALARGAKFNPEPGEIQDPYMASTVEGPLKPAYYEMNIALKYTLPGTFAIRQLAQSGVWSEAKTAERLKWAGWYPPDADEVAKAWTTQTTTASEDPWVSKANTQLWTATHKAYKGGGIDATQARERFDLIGIAGRAQTQVLARWDSEKTL